MKTKLTAFFLCLLLGGYMTVVKAQVTIGQNEVPEKYATLQIKDKVLEQGAALNAANADKGGFLLPRVELKKKKELLPFVTEQEVNGNSQEYKDAKLRHTGLIVYNLIENDEEELCIGINQWDGEQWNCLQNKLGNAVATVTDCSTIGFLGTYKNNESLSSGNYMTVKLNVTKAGAYTIIARAGYSDDHSKDNGYYFMTTGVFMTPGTYSLTVPGAGTPLLYTPTGQQGDVITITFNEKPLVDANGNSCPKNIFVENSAQRPLYTMKCNSVKVNGVYRINKPLVEDEHTITMTLEVSSLAFGATYIIETNTVEGIAFRATGLLSQANQPITLQPVDGSIPTSVTPKRMTITSNSETSVATCYATVDISLTKKKIVSIGGYATTYGYQFGSPDPYGKAVGMAQSAKMINSPANFGVQSNSIVRIEGIDVNTATDINEYYRYAPSVTQLKADLFNADGSINADIVILGVYWVPDAEQCQLLTEYLGKGGVLLCFMEYGGTLELVRTIFSDRSIAGAKDAYTAAGSIFQYPYLDDEILNGPFGDIRGKYWGEDASVTFSLSGLPAGLITQYSSNDDLALTSSPPASAVRVTAFRHKELNFIWVGDGGFNSGDATNTVNATACPFKIDESNNYIPVSRKSYGRGGVRRYDVYNSIFTANAIAWGLKKAQEREDNLD